MAEGVKRELEAAKKSIDAAEKKMDAGSKEECAAQIGIAQKQLAYALKNYTAKKAKRKPTLKKLNDAVKNIKLACANHDAGKDLMEVTKPLGEAMNMVLNDLKFIEQ